MILPSKNWRNVPSVLSVDDDLDNLQLISYVLKAMKLKFYGVNDSNSVFNLVIDKTAKVKHINRQQLYLLTIRATDSLSTTYKNSAVKCSINTLSKIYVSLA